MENNIEVKNNWDEYRQQIVMIIYSDYPNNGINRNGEIDYISSLKDKTQFYHSLYYVKHAETNYNNEPVYQSAINEARRSFNHLNLLLLNINQFRNIIFDHIEFENETNGLLSLPQDEPTKEQYEALNKLLLKLNEVGYEEISIQGVISKNNQDLHADVILTIEGQDILSIPDIIKEEYRKLNKKNIKQKKKR